VTTRPSLCEAPRSPREWNSVRDKIVGLEIYSFKAWRDMLIPVEHDF
jgi:hypothetical protein